MTSEKFIQKASKVYFLGGSAEAGNDLLAFDRALQKCGLHDANIIGISSVMPDNVEIEQNVSAEKIEAMIEPGDFCPVVVSRHISSNTGEKIFAAVAGCRFSSGYGVNVEVDGVEKSREEAREECVRMLEDMAERRDEDIDGEIVFEYNSAVVGDNSCCVFSGVLYTL